MAAKTRVKANENERKACKVVPSMATTALCRQTPKVGSVCPNRARTDLCRGLSNGCLYRDCYTQAKCPLPRRCVDVDANLQNVRNTATFSYMNSTVSTAQQIRLRIQARPVGEPFTPTAFLECGTRASVDQALSRLVKSEFISRVTRGMFVRPELNRFVGAVMPAPIQIAQTIAKTTGSIVQVHGAEAARQFELTTQVPMQPVFTTSGPSKRIHVGKMEIRLQHVCQRKLSLAGRPAGMALAALWYMGKGEVTPSVIEKIRHKLSITEFEALKSVTNAMPSWMSDVLFRHAQSVSGANGHV